MWKYFEFEFWKILDCKIKKKFTKLLSYFQDNSKKKNSKNSEKKYIEKNSERCEKIWVKFLNRI